MSESNKSYRIRTDVNNDSYVTVKLSQDYDSFDILSLKINSLDAYKHHNSKYGVIVGRVLANGGFGVPNAKISVFVESENPNMNELDELYPFTSTVSRDNDNIRYNLLPDNKVSDCHQVVGTFPNKRFMLDNNILVEMYDKYYKYTTRTNDAGDYMLACIPVGQQVIHMDLDLSDCGILSQRPRDFIYKGYNVEQFENPNQFRSGTEYETLSQIFSQDQVVYVQPFWGNESEGESIGITRADINIAYKFEPTCVFIGCVVSDNSSQGISKNCVPTEHMGDMDELVAGKGRIEMIRKTYGGSVEEFQINGTELINGEGIWCYQIPMNLDYIVTDEYGRMVPTDNPERGIPTRTRVRFRMSMEDMEENVDNFFRAKVLVPHNPQNLDGVKHEDYDYEFGTYTKDESFRDLFWNNVYTVKSYIPRFQKRKVTGWKAPKFTGIKHCQDYGSNNPIPYNNIRIKLPFMFRIMCILIKVFIKLVAIYNRVVALVGSLLAGLAELVNGIRPKWAGKIMNVAQSLHLNVIEDGLCPDLENWYFAPLVTKNGIKAKRTVKVKTEDGGPKHDETYDLVQQTMDVINDKDEYEDHESIDYGNDEDDDDAICITFKTDYLISCIEMNLAQEYKVINFDFYNDWVNGMVYFPRWMRYIRLKRSFRGNTLIKSETKACMDNTKIFSKARRYTQLCSLAYEKDTSNNKTTYSKVTTKLTTKNDIRKANNYHKKRGFSQVKIFGKNGGICHEKETMAGQHVYYLKPCEWLRNTTPAHKKVNLFATDLVLLGSLNECDIYGVPQAFKYLSSTSYIMPTNLALTNMDYEYSDVWVEIARVTTVGTTELTLSGSYRQLGFFIVGGGGGGAGDCGSSDNSGAGGNGGVVTSAITMKTSNSITITVGAGGSGGTSNTNTQTSKSGGTSQIVYNGVTYTANGGNGGLPGYIRYNNVNWKVENSGCGGGPVNGYSTTRWDNNGDYSQLLCEKLISGTAGEGEPFSACNASGVFSFACENSCYANGGNGLSNPFDSTDANLYGAGGGGGCNAYRGTKLRAYGGNTGGGDGGYGDNNATTNHGVNGSFYGAGGGGGAFSSNHTYSQGGNGYQGIVIIYGK